MDALSDILRGVRLTGGVFLDAEFTAPWCVLSQVTDEEYRAFQFNPAHLIAYHYVIEGRLLIQVDGEPAIEVSAGEIVLLPRNDPHHLGSTMSLKPTSVTIETPRNGGLARVRQGGGGERTRLVCGVLGSDAEYNPLLTTLPAVLKLNARQSGTSEWIESSFRFAAGELASRGIGSETVLSRLCELLFVEAVRQYAAGLPMERRGWLAGLRDPYVGRALGLLHARVAHPWTAEELAEEIGLSRSAFAERFTTVIGEPPLRYLALWRMQLAARRLRESHLPISRIAYEVGYESEAAFNRAFKREFGTPPAAWRKQVNVQQSPS